MLRLGKPTDQQLQACLRRLSRTRLSYPEAGATAGALPSGYHHDHIEVGLGSDPATFDRARQALLGWRAHRVAGISVYPPDAALRPGTDVVLVVPLGPIRAVAGCRVVYVVDEPGRFGFGYGTLPGHPERGEEAFMVSRGDGGVVSFSLTAFSRPANLVVRLGAPVGRRVQRRFMGRYLRAMITALG